jgi:hypothetical protein
MDELEADKSLFLARVLDYENDVEKTIGEAKSQQFRLPGGADSITIEEFADTDGYLTSTVDEQVWLASISAKTGLNCRMIVNYKPIKEVGLYTLRVLVAENGSPVEYEIKVWIISAPN